METNGRMLNVFLNGAEFSPIEWNNSFVGIRCVYVGVRVCVLGTQKRFLKLEKVYILKSWRMI